MKLTDEMIAAESERRLQDSQDTVARIAFRQGAKWAREYIAQNCKEAAIRWHNQARDAKRFPTNRPDISLSLDSCAAELLLVAGDAEMALKIMGVK